MPIEMIWQRKQDLFQKKIDFAFNGKKNEEKWCIFVLTLDLIQTILIEYGHAQNEIFFSD